MTSADVTALVQPGSILLLYCFFCKPPKEKFFVVTAVKPFALGFFINSELTQLQQEREHLRSSQLKLLQTDYPKLLKYDSWLDCSEAIEAYEVDEITAAIAGNPAKRYLGRLTDGDIARLTEVVTGSLTIEGSNIRKILKGFGAAA